jgi:micrococcal nuclease
VEVQSQVQVQAHERSERLSINMYEYRVKNVIKVVDGDTIDVEIDLGFDISITQRVRLAGIDTPESRTRDLAEKALGLEVKELLQRKLEEAKVIVIKTEKPDSTGKFGRVIGWLHLDNAEVSLNKTLVASGYAWKYDGGTKQKDFGLLKIKRAESTL